MYLSKLPHLSYYTLYSRRTSGRNRDYIKPREFKFLNCANHDQKVLTSYSCSKKIEKFSVMVN